MAEYIAKGDHHFHSLHWPVDIDRLKKLKPVSIEWWRKNITASPCGRDGMVVGSTTICDKVCQLLAIRDRSVVFSGSLHQYNWPPRHNWNIVEYIQWSPIIVYYSIFQSKRVLIFSIGQYPDLSRIASNWQTLSHIVVDPTTIPSRPQGLAVIFLRHQECVKRRREDTFFAAQSESRILAPFFASKTV
jgi:hypothetical protein